MSTPTQTPAEAGNTPSDSSGDTVTENAELTATATATAQATPADDGVWTTVSRVVFPENRDEDTLPLYIEYGRRSLATPASSPSDTEEPAQQGQAAQQPQGSQSSSAGEVHSDDVISRRSVTVRPGARASFATYFNAFPASYWYQWTDVRKVRLRVEVDGDATVIVYRSNARGSSQRVASHGTTAGPLSIELDLKTFGDGGWYWFDIVAGRKRAKLRSAEWQVEGAPVRPGTLSIGVTTLNRPDFCNDVIRVVSESSDLRAILDTLYIVDQGTKKVADYPGFNELAEVMGPQLRIVDQDNLGGSGGFARGMYETVQAGSSTYHMMLDDDVNIEPEGIVRAVAFASFCRRPTLVGGHMFDLYNKTVLHTWGEEVEKYSFTWGPVRGLTHGHDFAAKGIRETPWTHRRIDVEYNGWWMTVVPVEVIKEIGLSLPVFIKWDDAEFGLRAKAAGYPTVTLPGAAVWHMSWADKDDTIDWQAYYHERNKLLVALLYSPYHHGGSVLQQSLQVDLKHLFEMRYYANALRHLAIRDLLEGPEHLHATLRTTLPTLRALATEYADSSFSPDPDAYPLPERVKPPRKGKVPTYPKRSRLVPYAVLTAAKQLRPVNPKAMETPEARVPHATGKWWNLSQYDSAIVTKADGSGAAWYRRDPETFRAQLAESVKLHAQLRREWQRLRTQYQAAFPEFTSIGVWEQTFGNTAGEPEGK